MSLLRLSDIGLAFGHHPLLAHANATLERGERVCLIGRNGTGKSSLLGVIAGTLAPDEGTRVVADGLRMATLPQEIPTTQEGSVAEVVASGLGTLGEALADYERVSASLAITPDDAQLARLAALQHTLDSHDGWRLKARVGSVLSALGLTPDAPFATLSGGWRRRALLAQALVAEPDLLLLDEPTNHLDIGAIQWLEDTLLRFAGAVVFVTHDRAFLKRLATRIWELDRGTLRAFAGDYEAYRTHRDEELAAEERQDALFDKRLAAEEAWIRQGVQARRTRNEGRVRALKAARAARQARRARPGRAALSLTTDKPSGDQVFVLEHVHLAYGPRVIVQDFSATVMRGDKIALVGPNGIGKTTLLQALTGEITPTRGRILRGTRLTTAYFDQTRAQLNPEATVMESVGEGTLTVTVNGRTQHVASYLRGLLFPAQRLHSPVGQLSGGERNRLLLARLFARAANLLILDEPTNDLDLETLDLLEEMVLAFTGTLLIVSHDRDFIDRVASSAWVFTGGGVVREQMGDWGDWAAARPKAPEAPPPAGPGPAARPKPPRRGPSYHEKRELAALPQVIEALEDEQQQLQERLSDPASYRDARTDIPTLTARLAAVEREIAARYARWEELEDGSGS